MEPDVSSIASAELLEQLGDAVTILGPDWRYRYVSHGAAQLIGRPAADVIGLHVWEEVFPEVVGTPQYDAALRAMQTRSRESIEWYFEAVGRWYCQVAVPVGDALVFLVTDVTENRRAADRAEVLLRCGEALARASSFDEVTSAVLDHAPAHVGAIAGGVLLVDEERGIVQSFGLETNDPAVQKRWTEYSLDLSTPGIDAFRRRQPVHVLSLADAQRDYPAIVSHLLATQRRAISAYPLTSSDASLGVLILAYDADRTPAQGEAQFLSTAAAMTAQALLRVRLLDVERRSVQELQRSLLPGNMPTLAGLDIAVRYVASDAAAEVGGDWYDVVELPGGSVGLVMGDVEGHDLGAAAIMGLVRGAVRAYALDGHPPALVMERSNSFLSGLDLGRIVTVSYAQIHAETLLVTAVSAGHLPTLVAEPGLPVRIVPAETGPPLGVTTGMHLWPETTSQLADRATVVLFTDGLVERRGRDIDAGIDVLTARLHADRGLPVEVLVDGLLGLRPTNSFDDVAVVVARLTQRSPSARTVTRQLPARPASVHLARRFTRQVLDAWQIPDAITDDAELAVSELVTNAARHSEDALEVMLDHPPRLLRIAVTDTSHRMPPEAVPVEEDATSGRGLMLVQAVADRWGVESTGLSKRVWAEFDVPAD